MKKNKRWILFFILIIALSAVGCRREDADAGKPVLILGTLFDNSQLSNAVTDFNKENSSVQIEIKNYSAEAADVKDALNNIKMEIVSGKGPDLLNFGMYYSEGDAAGGILDDLYPYIEADAGFKKDDYFYNILNAFSVNEKLYVLVPDFRINSFATTAPELKNKENWNIDELMNCYNDNSKERILFPGETKKAVFGMLCTGSIDNYVDWTNGTGYFDSDSFQKLLLFANQFPIKLIFAEDSSAQTEFMENKALLFPITVSDEFAANKTRTLLQAKVNFIGYPLDKGNGNIAQSNSITIGIGKNCKYKEEAWEFLKSIIGEEFQDNITNGLPIRRSALEKRLDKAMKPEYMENGEKKTKYEILFEGEEPIPIYEITKEDAEQLKSIIERVEYNSFMDEDLYNIIMEEADFYFQGDRTAEETGSIIQSRVQIYINEKK